MSSSVPSILSRRTFLSAVATAAAAATIPVRSDPNPGVDLTRVARVRVHPSLGVARVGNSPDAFFFGPELPGSIPAGPFKDATGAIARQAARFRIYAYDDRGEVLGELAADQAEIIWDVRVGNGKGSWYDVDEPFDVPGAASTPRRNPDVKERGSLNVQSRAVAVSGAAARPEPLSGGFFLGVPVPLGEVFTDALGRLVVMPGHGQAIRAPGAPPLSGLDANGWIDTTADGPVRATVRFRGRTLQADPAWVLCTIPNYAPGVATAITTLYDAVESALVTAGRRSSPSTDFHRDVLPIFLRMSQLQWVNAGYLETYGFLSGQDWSDPVLQAGLADPSPGNAIRRRALFARFRDPAFSKVEPDLEPQLYGDKILMPPNNVEPRQWLALTPLQYTHLRRWAEGDFTVAPTPRPARIEDLPVSQQPTALDRATLDGCLGGAFHPGVEFPWLARMDWVWTEDFRLRARALEPDLTDYGPEMTARIALSRTGPLSRIGPGDLIRWMGIPWQADAASCRFGYQKAISLVSPGFWPARIPNSVLTEADYRTVIDTGRSLDERRAAFLRRRPWERFIARPTSLPSLSLMVEDWFKLGMIRDREGAKDGKFPARMVVESDVGYASEPEVDYPNYLTMVQLPMFPMVVTNSDDNSLRSFDEAGRMEILKLSAPIARPEGITRDRYRNLYVAAMDGGAVIKVTPDGVVTPYASGLEIPVAVVMDRSGNLYVANRGSGGWIAHVRPDGSMRTLVAPGLGIQDPLAIALTPDGVLLVANNGSGMISRVDPVSGKILDLSWLSGIPNPRAMAFDSYLRLHVLSRGFNTVLRFGLDGTPLPLTIQGAAMNAPFGMGIDFRDVLYVTSGQGDSIQRIRIQGDVGTSDVFSVQLRNPGGLVFAG